MSVDSLGRKWISWVVPRETSLKEMDVEGKLRTTGAHGSSLMALYSLLRLTVGVSLSALLTVLTASGGVAGGVGILIGPNTAQKSNSKLQSLIQVYALWDSS